MQGLTACLNQIFLLRLSENFDLGSYTHVGKAFPCAPSLLVLVFPQSCCCRLRLLVGWVVSNVFLCCTLCAPSEDGRYLTTAVLQQPHLAFSTLIQLLLAAWFWQCVKMTFRTANFPTFDIAFLYLRLRATLRPTQVLTEKRVVTHTVETESALTVRCFPHVSARPWWAQLCSGAGECSGVWNRTDGLVSGICHFNAPAVLCLSLKWMLLGSITGEWYKSDKTNTNRKYNKIAGTIQKDSYSRAGLRALIYFMKND